MIDLTNIKDIYLYSGSIDFRYGILGLSSVVCSSFNGIPPKDTLFLFCNKSKTQVKLIQFDSTGIWLYQKRLSNTKFIYPDTKFSTKNKNIISKDELKIILSGLDFIRKIEGKLDKHITYY